MISSERYQPLEGEFGLTLQEVRNNEGHSSEVLNQGQGAGVFTSLHLTWLHPRYDIHSQILLGLYTLVPIGNEGAGL